jgi:hypothetical protein
LEINHALARLGSRPRITDTPIERAHKLSSLIPEAQEPANCLVTEYQQEIFGILPADLNAARQAASEIRLLSFKSLLRTWFARLQKPPLPSPNSRFPAR